MPSLSDTASKQLKRINRRPDLPEWWILFQIGAGVVVVLAIVFSFIAGVGGGTDVAAPAGRPVSVPSGDPGFDAPPPADVAVPPRDSAAPTATMPAETAPDTTGPAGDQPGNTDVLTLPFISGSTVDVPSASFERVKAIVAASFGDGAAISEVTVGFASDTRIAFSIEIDPDAAGPQIAQSRSIVVTQAGDSWTGSF